MYVFVTIVRGEEAIIEAIQNQIIPGAKVKIINNIECPIMFKFCNETNLTLKAIECN